MDVTGRMSCNHESAFHRVRIHQNIVDSENDLPIEADVNSKKETATDVFKKNSIHQCIIELVHKGQ